MKTHVHDFQQRLSDFGVQSILFFSFAVFTLSLIFLFDNIDLYTIYNIALNSKALILRIDASMMLFRNYKTCWFKTDRVKVDFDEEFEEILAFCFVKIDFLDTFKDYFQLHRIAKKMSNKNADLTFKSLTNTCAYIHIKLIFGT